MLRALVLLPIFLVGCLSSPSSSIAPATPVLQPGMHWQTRSVGHFAQGDVQSVHAYRVEAIEEHQGSMSYRIYRRDQGTDASGHAINGNMTVWLRVTDWATVAARGSSREPYRTVQLDNTNDPPCREIVWPLQVGSSWNMPCPYTVELPSPAHIVRWVNATVVAQEDVTVPAGTFHTFRVEGTQSIGASSTHRTQWLSPENCGVVKEILTSPLVTTSVEMTEAAC